MRDSPLVENWDEALLMLDRYPWVSLSPIRVHPTFRKASGPRSNSAIPAPIRTAISLVGVIDATSRPNLTVNRTRRYMP